MTESKSGDELITEYFEDIQSIVEIYEDEHCMNENAVDNCLLDEKDYERFASDSPGNKSKPLQ